jgi:hypothetical protein
MRTERCACGGVLEAENPAASALAVSEHNATVLHQRWRSRGGFGKLRPERNLPRTVFETESGPWDGYEHRRPRQSFDELLEA